MCCWGHIHIHLNPSHLVVPVGTIYCVAVEHRVRLGTHSHYFVLLHKEDKEICERVLLTPVSDGSCALSDDTY